MRRPTTFGVCLITTAVAFGQTAQTPLPTCEVASIKPAAPGQRGRFIRPARTVIDKTGLSAKYDINLEWAPDESQIRQMQVPPDVPLPTFDPDGPSLFTAIQEQLGLKLESQKGPVEVFVIDHAEKPSEN